MHHHIHTIPEAILGDTIDHIQIRYNWVENFRNCFVQWNDNDNSGDTYMWIGRRVYTHFG